MNSLADSPWSNDGYVTESTYTRHFLKYQSPIGMSFAANLNGFAAPDFRRPFTYCDFGCGEAITLLALAEAYPHGTFVGVDLNAAHIENARALASRASLTNVSFFQGTFDAFSKANAAEFDYAAAHGVYSWVSREVQQSLNAAVSNCLKPGGLFYFCHYVLPGAAETEAVFRVFQSLLASGSGTLEDRAKQALSKLEHLIGKRFPIFREYPGLEEFHKDLKKRDTRYLIHEFCNKHFRPAYFEDVADDLAGFGFTFVGTTRSERNQTKNLLAAAHGDELDGLSLLEAEIHAGLLANDTFRWDVFQKDAGQKSQQPLIDDYYIDSAVIPYAYPKKTTLWHRGFDLDTPLVRSIVKHAHKGKNTIGEVLSNATSTHGTAEQGRQVIADLLSSRLFQVLAAQAPDPRVSPEDIFQLDSNFADAQFERDFATEGFLCLPSKISGSAILLNGYQALATRECNKSTVASALERAEQAMKATQDQRRRSGRKPKDWDPEKEKKSFMKQTLPHVTKLGLLQDP